MKKETMKQVYDGYMYRGFHIKKVVKHYFRSNEVIWLIDDKVFFTRKEAKEYIDSRIKNGWAAV